MATKAAGEGRWEVVKRGRRPGAGAGGRGGGGGGRGGGGGGDRRALGEANGVWKYDLTREYRPLLSRACLGSGQPARWPSSAHRWVD